MFPDPCNFTLRYVITGLNGTKVCLFAPLVIDNVKLATGFWRNINIALQRKEGKRFLERIGCNRRAFKT